MPTNTNSSEAYSADSNDNISKIAGQIAAAGGLLVTDRVTDNATVSGKTASVFLSGANLFALYTDSSQLCSLAAW